MKKLILLFALLLSFLNQSFSQNQHFVDSLQSQLKKHNDQKLELGKNAPAMYDSTAANILSSLAYAHCSSNPVKAMEYAEQTLAISQRIGYKKGMGKANYNMGVIYNMKGDFLQGLDFFNKALRISRELGNKKSMAGNYNGIGNTYLHLGNYPEALKNYFSALKIQEESGDTLGMAGANTNIGIVYQHQENYPEALKYFFSSLKMFRQVGAKQGTANAYNNIGVIYNYQFKYSEAMTNLRASLKIREETGDKHGEGYSYKNIGEIYQAQGNYPEALKNYLASLKIREEIGDKDGVSGSYQSIGLIYSKLKRYQEASEYLNKALSLSKETGSLQNIKLSYAGLATLDSAQGNFKRALEYYKRFITTRDSLFNKENTKKTIQQQMQYDFDKKETLAKADQEKKDALANKELQKQKLVRNGFIGGFGIMVLFAWIFFAQRNKIKMGKKRSDELLLNILPSEVAEELKEKGSADAKQFSEVTVMFTDFKGFTQISEKLSPTELVNEIHTCFKAFDDIVSKYNVEKIKTIGDSYMCAGGLPVANKTNATDVINAALAIQQYMLAHLEQRKNENKELFELRIGVHTGSVVAGIVGVKKFAYDIWGDTVNIASRMESSGEVGKVNISGSTYELVKDKFNCIHRGKIQAKNKGEIDMYFVEEVSNNEKLVR